jgi:hypothetical protein
MRHSSRTAAQTRMMLFGRRIRTRCVFRYAEREASFSPARGRYSDEQGVGADAGAVAEYRGVVIAPLIGLALGVVLRRQIEVHS